MAMTVRELKDWLSTLDDDDLVAIDEDGLTLSMVGVNGPDGFVFHPVPTPGGEIYIEIGGEPLEEEESDASQSGIR